MGIDMSAIKELTAAIDGRRSERQPTVARARVVQADGGGTWVQVDGGASRTPVASSTVAVDQGDEVMVRIDGGKATVTGNVSRPSTDDSAARELRESMEPIVQRVTDAEGSISEVRQDADSLRTRIESAEGDISSMEQTAEGWTFISQMKGATSAAASAASTAQATANSARGDAAEAAKTATSFMSFINGVLSIGEMGESGPVGTHTEQSANGFAVKSADGTKLMELTKSKLAWLADSVSIFLQKLSVGDNILTIKADYLRLVGEDSFIDIFTSKNTGKTYAQTSGTLIVGESIRVDGLTVPKTVHGHVSVSNVAGGGYKDVSINFGHTFASSPDVMAVIQNNDTSAYTNHHGVEVHSVTTTGCKIRVHNANVSTAINPGVSWVAFG